jgi:hypothetical protein
MPPFTGGSSLGDVLTAIQSLSQNCQQIAKFLNEQSPDLSSGKLTATTLVQTGFVRVTGVSVIVAGAAGSLNDAATAALAVTGNVVYTVQATVGFYPVNMVFLNGLVYTPGAGQEIAIFYTRV